jgi:hypothetical protein
VDLDSYHPWFLGLSLGGASAVAAFITAKLSTGLSAQLRRLLFALAALLAFATTIAVALTGTFFVVFAGYCEDVGFCSPKWWVYVGLSLYVVVIAALVLIVTAIREYRRVT